MSGEISLYLIKDWMSLNRQVKSPLAIQVLNYPKIRVTSPALWPRIKGGGVLK